MDIVNLDRVCYIQLGAEDMVYLDYGGYGLTYFGVWAVNLILAAMLAENKWVKMENPDDKLEKK